MTKDKARSLGAELLLQYALQKRGIERESFSFAYGEHKKPYLQGVSMPYFNLSHSGDFVVVAISATAEVGVDIEEIKEFREGVLKKVFTEKEIAYIKNQPDQNQACYQQWSLKESVIKAIGTGFSLAPQSFSVPIWNTDIISINHQETYYYCMSYPIPKLPYTMAICSTKKELPQTATQIELTSIFSFCSHKYN